MMSCTPNGIGIHAATKRSNVEHAQGNQCLPAVRKISKENKRNSRCPATYAKRLRKSSKGNKSRKKENLRLLVEKVYMIAGFLLSYHFVLRFTKEVIRFSNTVTY